MWACCLPAYLPTYLPAYLPACLPACLPTCLPACLCASGATRAATPTPMRPWPLLRCMVIAADTCPAPPALAGTPSGFWRAPGACDTPERCSYPPPEASPRELCGGTHKRMSVLRRCAKGGAPGRGGDRTEEIVATKSRVHTGRRPKTLQHCCKHCSIYIFFMLFIYTSNNTCNFISIAFFQAVVWRVMWASRACVSVIFVFVSSDGGACHRGHGKQKDRGYSTYASRTLRLRRRRELACGPGETSRPWVLQGRDATHKYY